MDKQPYQKLWKSYEDQVEVFKTRGLVVGDNEEAVAFLRHTNYYRFSGYCLAFETDRHQFQTNITFGQIQAAYEFDRKLRDLVNEALEIVELDSRTAVAHHFGKKYGPLGHSVSTSFHNKFEHYKWIFRVQDATTRSREIFIRHFRKNYSDYPHLPIWVLAEIISFGSLSFMCKGMHKQDQKAISHVYGLQPQTWVSWLHHLVYIRNMCAHHARLWDRTWSISPELPHGKNWSKPLVRSNRNLFATLLILRHLMHRCPSAVEFASSWKTRIEQLLNNPPTASYAMEKMGLHTNWTEHPIWK